MWHFTWVFTVCQSTLFGLQMSREGEISNNVVCATSKGSDRPAHRQRLIRAFAIRLNILWISSYWPNIVFEFLSLKGDCTGSSESIHVKMQYCWKSHVVAKKTEKNTSVSIGQFTLLRLTFCLSGPMCIREWCCFACLVRTKVCIFWFSCVYVCLSWWLLFDCYIFWLYSLVDWVINDCVTIF